jgi:DNA-binding XRE family transcriptional regulator
MAQSSISQLLAQGELPGLPLEHRLSATLDAGFRRRLGLELRRRRMELGLTQASLGEPMSKGFVSAVERGRAIPSLPALRLMASRLDTTIGAFLLAVEEESSPT